MQEHFFDQRGLYYRMNAFQLDRPTLVFVHGLTGSSSAWIPYEEKFQAQYNLLTFDLRGHGKSTKHKGYTEYTIEKFCDDLHALLAHLNIHQFILISHSFGTLVALQYLQKYGQIPQACLFFSPNYSAKKKALAGAVNALLFFAPALSHLPLGKKTGKHIDYNLYRHTGDWNLRRMRADILNTSFRVYAYCIRQAFTFSCEQFLSSIHIPTLIVHGRKDSIFPVENARAMSRMIPYAQLQIMEHDNHILVLNDLSGSIQAIEKFVATLFAVPHQKI